MKGIELGVKIAGISLLFLSLSLISFWPNFEWVIFGLIMLLIGIPHGAIDHLTSDPEIKIKSLVKFILRYLSLIGIYIFVWWLIPVLALVLFILMSAYHFGQTHFIGRDSTSRARLLLYLPRGLFILSIILFGDFAYTAQILETIIDISTIESARMYIISGLFVSTLLAQWISKIEFNMNDLIDLILLPIVLFNSPLMLSFVFYFGFWHAFPSMVEEYNFLKKYPKFNSIKKFGIQLLPFTLMSVFGIGLILLITKNKLTNEEMIFVFFVLISVISFPHIIYMDRFLKKKSNTAPN